MSAAATPDDAVAFVPLYWLIEEAKKYGLHFKEAPIADPDAIRSIDSSQDKDGRLYDSRAGLGAYYRYGPHKVFDLCNDPSVGVSVPTPKIHESVFDRIDSGCNSYSPIGLPPDYVIVSRNGKVTPLGEKTFETSHSIDKRYKAQERLWNFVWMRRLAYFATLAASAHLAVFWLFHNLNKEHEYSSSFRLVSEADRFIESFLPRSIHWWTDWYGRKSRVVRWRYHTGRPVHGDRLGPERPDHKQHADHLVVSRRACAGFRIVPRQALFLPQLLHLSGTDLVGKTSHIAAPPRHRDGLVRRDGAQPFLFKRRGLDGRLLPGHAGGSAGCGGQGRRGFRKRRSLTQL